MLVKSPASRVAPNLVMVILLSAGWCSGHDGYGAFGGLHQMAADAAEQFLLEPRIAVAAEDDRGLEGEVGAHFGRCPYYVLVEANGDTVAGSRIVSNPYFELHRPGVMPRFIRDLGANVIIAGGMGPRAIEMFHSFGIDVHRLD